MAPHTAQKTQLYLTQPKYRRRAFVLRQNYVPDFIDFPWEALLPLRIGWGCGGGKMGKAGEEGGEMGLICKREKIILK